MYFSLTLILVATGLAAIDWFVGAPSPGEAEWPRYAKLIGACIVGAIGLINALEGWWRSKLGKRAYRQGDYHSAIEHLGRVEETPFRNRQAIDYLALSLKKRAEMAQIKIVQEANFARAIELLVESISRYPRAPFAHNNLINIFRRSGRWEEAETVLDQLTAKIRAGDFTSGRDPIPEKDIANLLVTAANFWVDDANPNWSLDKALSLYKEARDVDPDNRFVILNYPPRLMRKAELTEVMAERKALLQQVYEIASHLVRWTEKEDEAFALLNLIDVLADPDFHILGGDDLLCECIIKLEALRFSVNIDDEAGLVLAKAFKRLNDIKGFDRAIAQAELEKHSFNEKQIETLDALKSWRALKNT